MSEESKSQKHVSIRRRKNVLSRIIIPKLKVTIKFILSEVEEKEREDVFRLKRFKQLKSKKKNTEAHICCCCLSMFASEEDVVESTCPVCKKASKAKGKSEITLNVVPCKSAIAQGKENKKLLDHLMSHIDDVIDLTRQYKLDGIVPASIDMFIRTCSQVKETIEDYANAPPLCDVCKKFLEATGSRVKLASKAASSKSLTVPCAPEKTSEGVPPCTESCYNLGPEKDKKLGYFEKKFKEIVKVTRLQNEDGSVSEEKQVITIRTERRNPRKDATFDSNADDKFLGPGGGRGKDYGGGTDYGGDGGPDFRSGPRETKSEHANRSHQMGEPRLRSCMSASHPKSTMNKDASTNFDSSACMTAKTSKVTLPPSPSTTKIKNTCGPLPKISKSSSVDSHVCCPRKTSSVCGSELESGPTSQTSIASEKPAVTSASAQTCCKEVPVKKPMKDQGTCCLPICGGDKVCPDNKDNKFKTTSTEALWRDVWTSTTDLAMEPSLAPSRTRSKAAASRKTTPVPSCTSVESNDSSEQKSKKSNCCTIKIIAKPPKVCCIKEKPKQPEKEIVLPGSMFETIKNIFLPPTRSSESCKVEVKEPEIKNICKSCLSKLSSFAPSASAASETSSCKMCQSSMASQRAEETKSCPSCGSLAKVSSCGSMSCKSMGIGSSTSHTCVKTPSTPSLHSQKHSCCLEKKSKNSDEEDETTCCAMAQANRSSKSICCSKKKTSSVCCPAKSSNTSLKSTKSASGSCSMKTATTNTKRSSRFDVRPLRRHTCEKVNLGACTCQSEPNVNRHRGGRKPVKRCQSFYENEYYFFKW